MRSIQSILVTIFIVQLCCSWAAVAYSELSSGSPGLETSNEYIVLRNGKKIGTHDIRFKGTRERLTVISQTKMRVKFLFITAYRYDYVSTEQWHNGQLISVATDVNDNGKKSTASATLQDQGYVTRLNGKTGSADSPLFTTNHWNVGAMEQTGLFNTITASVNQISVDHVLQDQRYKVRGELNIDSFYDDHGHWLGMQFEHSDGSIIEFRCQVCTNTPGIGS